VVSTSAHAALYCAQVVYFWHDSTGVEQPSQFGRLCDANRAVDWGYTSGVVEYRRIAGYCDRPSFICRGCNPLYELHACSIMFHFHDGLGRRGQVSWLPLQEFDVGFNNLTGPIPSDWNTGTPRFTALDVQDNGRMCLGRTELTTLNEQVS
jgi:hypothetical protein